jgi:hypothetical protein
MKKKAEEILQKKWWFFNDRLEEIISNICFSNIGMIFFIITLPVSFVLKTIQWLMYLIGSWSIKLISTTDKSS